MTVAEEKAPGLTPVRLAVFAMALAIAGLPLYTHAPKFFAETYGIGLGTLGLALLALRLLDFVQDPLLGTLADRLGHWQGIGVGLSMVLLAAGFVAAFVITAPIPPIWWFVASMAVVFTAYSFVQITFYARGVALAEAGRGHIHIAKWRESGALLGVCFAALLPTGLGLWGMESPMAGFAAVFSVLALLAIIAMAGQWDPVARPPATLNVPSVMAHRPIYLLLLIGLLNTAPLAVSSTLFLFFVEARLEAPQAAGPLLVVFFLSAALAVPGWALLAQRIGARRALLWAMGLAMIGFSFATLLEAGDVWLFALICLASGAALGADFTLLPALFAQRVAAMDLPAGVSFGLWNFCTKATLALAAATVLPVLQLAGFVPGLPASPTALMALTLCYAALPVALKLLAFGLLFRLDEYEILS